MLNKKYPIKKYVQNLILMNAYMDEMLHQLNEIVIEDDDSSSSNSKSQTQNNT